MNNDNNNLFIGGMDTLSVGVVVATLANWLPTIAAGLSVVWFLIRIAESDLFAYLVYDWRKKWADAPVKKKDEESTP